MDSKHAVYNETGHFPVNSVHNLVMLLVAIALFRSGCATAAHVPNRISVPKLSQAIESGDIGMGAELISSGEDVNQDDGIGNSPLHYAVGNNHPAIALRLLKSGAVVDKRNSQGIPPLNYAVGARNASMAQILLEQGVSVNSDGGTDLAPILVATENQDLPMLKLLITNGADVNSGMMKWRTPLMRASGLNAVEIMKYLLAEGANVNAVDDEDNTALLTASLSEAEQAFELLIALGADVVHKNKEGQSSLAFAAYNGNVNMVSTLLKHGADYNDNNAEGRGPLYFASMAKKDEAIRLLADAGATPTTVESTIEDIEATPYLHTRFGDLHRATGRSDQANLNYCVASQWYTKTVDVYNAIVKSRTGKIWGTYLSNALPYVLASEIAKHKAKPNTVITPSGNVVGVGAATYKIEGAGDLRESRAHYRELEDLNRKLAGQ